MNHQPAKPRTLPLIARAVLSLCSLIVFTTADSLATAQDHIHVTTKQYPSYGVTQTPESSKGSAFPVVPVIFDHRWPENTAHDFFVMHESQILNKSIWACHDPALGFCLGCNCMCTCSNGTTLYGESAARCLGAKWYLWFRWHGKAAHQPLEYVYSDSNSPYCMPSPDNPVTSQDESENGTEEAFFAPVEGSTYLKYWNNHDGFLSSHVNVNHPTQLKEPKAEIWRQFTKICPKTFTDSLRDNFGWEGPNIYPEPNGRELAPAIDLRAGMRLRVDFAAYNDADSSSDLKDSDAGRLHRGYVGSGTSYFSVTRMPRDYSKGGGLGPFGLPANPNKESVLVLDSFFGHMNQAMDVPGLSVEGKPNVVGSPFDIHLTKPYQMKRYLRLVYPTAKDGYGLPATDEFGQSALYMDVKNHPAIVSADLRGGMSAASLFGFVTSQHFAVDPPEDREFHRNLLVLRGRTFPIPEIAITLNGVETFVPCGTRLRQLADRHLEVSPAAMARQVQLYRRHEGRPIFVHFRDDDAGMVFEIPLMKGDIVKW